jgi:hypothetical protein
VSFAERIAAAWDLAAGFASQRAAALNEAKGTSRTAATAQSGWIAAFERFDAQAERVRLMVIEDTDEDDPAPPFLLYRCPCGRQFPTPGELEAGGSCPDCDRPFGLGRPLA